MLRTSQFIVLITYITILLSFIFGMTNNTKESILYVGIDGNSPPFCISNDIGEVRGYNIDLMKSIGHALGIRIEFKVMPFSSLKNYLISGQIDAILAPFNTKNPLNREDVLLTNEYYTNSLNVAVYKMNSYEFSPENLKGENICVTDKPYVLNYIRKNLSQANILIYKSTGETTKALYDGDCKVIVDMKSSINYYITKHKLKKFYSFPITKAKEYEHSYKIALRKGNEQLLDAINEAIDHIKQIGEFDRINKKWFFLEHNKLKPVMKM